MKRTVALIIFLTLLATSLFFLAFSSLQNTKKSSTVSENLNTEKNKLTSADTSLMLLPDSFSLSSSGSAEVAVVIDTGKNSITGAQIELGYDPNVITAVQIRPGVFIESPVELLNRIDLKTGRISYALGVPLGKTPVQGKGIVAYVTVKKSMKATYATAQSYITILPKSLVTSLGENGSVLKNMKGSTINVSQ